MMMVLLIIAQMLMMMMMMMLMSTVMVTRQLKLPGPLLRAPLGPIASSSSHAHPGHARSVHGHAQEVPPHLLPPHRPETKSQISLVVCRTCYFGFFSHIFVFL
jgi:hypothetical protein